MDLILVFCLADFYVCGIFKTRIRINPRPLYCEQAQGWLMETGCKRTASQSCKSLCNKSPFWKNPNVPGSGNIVRKRWRLSPSEPKTPLTSVTRVKITATQTQTTGRRCGNSAPCLSLKNEKKKEKKREREYERIKSPAFFFFNFS